MGGARYAVRAARCDHRSSDEEVYRALERVTAPLARAWARLETADRIALKVNVVWPPAEIRCTAGRRQELVDEAVMRSVLRLLRERTRAELYVMDTNPYPDRPTAHEEIHFRPLLQEFGATYIDCNQPPFARYEVPGGGLMFSRYLLHACFAEGVPLVSVATLKSHAFAGVTLCSKNLFGLCPVHPTNRPRTYFHHLIRLPFVLADLARILQPCLNIVDGLVGQSGREWGGEARVADTLIAGDHPVATDACAAFLMGHEPGADWPTPPFRRDRSHLAVAAASGYGTVDLNEVDFGHDLRPPVAHFDSEEVDAPEMVAQWRRSMCEQALYYRENRQRFLDAYAGEYVYLQGGEVLWHGPWFSRHISRRQWSGHRPGSAVWLKYVDASEEEGERLGKYQEELARLTGDSAGM